MAITDASIVMIGALALTYLTVYQKNKLIGNLIFVGIGLASLALDTFSPLFGVIIAIIGIANIIYDLLGK